VAKRGRAAGSGVTDGVVVATPDIPVNSIPVTIGTLPRSELAAVLIKSDVNGVVLVYVKIWEAGSRSLGPLVALLEKVLDADAPSLPVPVTVTCPLLVGKNATESTVKVTSVNVVSAGANTALGGTVNSAGIGTALGSVVCVSVAA
jgi:hypothetical protein